MGFFRETLEDAQKALKKDDLVKCFDICQEHFHVHANPATTGILYRLKSNIDSYTEDLKWLASQNPANARTGKEFNDLKAEAEQRLDHLHKLLKAMKKNIQRLIDLKRVKLS